MPDCLPRRILKRHIGACRREQLQLVRVESCLLEGFVFMWESKGGDKSMIEIHREKRAKQGRAFEIGNGISVDESIKMEEVNLYSSRRQNQSYFIPATYPRTPTTIRPDLHLNPLKLK